MAQFYFLSILLNVLCGLVLVFGANHALPDSGDEAQSKSFADGFKGLDDKTFRLVIGVLGAFVGLLKFLSVYRNDIPVIGDLFPALCGICGGAALLVEFYITTTTEDSMLPDWVRIVFVENRKYIGVACMISGVLHFILPQVPVL